MNGKRKLEHNQHHAKELEEVADKLNMEGQIENRTNPSNLVKANKDLRPAVSCAILIIEKGNTREAATLYNYNCYLQTAVNYSQ